MNTNKTGKAPASSSVIEQATPANLEPMVVPTPAVGSHISPETLLAVLMTSGANLGKMKASPTAPDWLKSFEPISGHRPADAAPGVSTFFSEEEVENLSLNEIVDTEVEAGHGGSEAALCFIVNLNKPIGVTYPARPTVKIKKIHGSLQGVLEYKPAPTATMTIVITNEGPAGWALASLYPGRPDEQPNLQGLKEGDEISLTEAEARGMRVKVI